MSKPEPTRDRKIDPKVAMFYQTLGELNTSLVAKVIRNPKLIGQVTDSMGDFMRTLSEEQCAEGFEWDGVQCVKIRTRTGISTGITR